MVAHDLSGHLATMDWKQLAVAVAIPLAGGIGGSLATANEITTWYRGINKPSWTPPNWLFGPVWTALYCMMGLASYLVWRQGGFERQAVPLAVYGVQLVLNFLWTPLFFKVHRLDLASLDIAGMWVAIVATIRQFRPVIGDLALLLLVPYLVWVSYASALTFWIWRHNPTRPARAKAF
ncbi:TspO/MBR-related protein [Scenedesmus sp. NREL 46B-D3]|nr:TspO/MBR-related protein [Scenedesmus sp. NREL 46B-D3]